MPVSKAGVFEKYSKRPSGLMDKASASGAGDCGLEPGWAFVARHIKMLSTSIYLGAHALARTVLVRTVVIISMLEFVKLIRGL